MSGAAPILPDLTGLRTLHAGSLVLAGGFGAVLEMCLLTLCLPWEASAIQLEAVEWRRGIVVVPARGTQRTRMIPLSTAALQAILRIAGQANGKGQAVTAGRGTPLRHQVVRLDRMQDRLSAVAPDTGLVDWNFHGIRAAATDILRRHGVPDAHVQEALGLRDADVGTGKITDRVERMISVAETWSRILLDGQRLPSVGRDPVGRKKQIGK